MNEKDLKAFIDVVINYFKEVTDIEAKMGLPFIKNGSSVILDHTGVIGISGNKKGAIYLTAKTEMLKELAQIILNMEDISNDDIVDMAGEVANTIAGNVRETFGSSFMISVPIILKGQPEDILLKLNPPVFIIPIEWKNYQAYLAVGLE